MVEDTMKAVREAEEKAAQLIRDASEQGKKLVEDAKKQAQIRQEETALRFKSDLAAARKESDREGSEYLKRAVEEADVEIDAMNAAAKKKADAAVAMIISELI